MLYTIPIDRASVKRNPNAGLSQYYAPIRTETTFYVWHDSETMPEELGDGKIRVKGGNFNMTVKGGTGEVGAKPWYLQCVSPFGIAETLEYLKKFDITPVQDTVVEHRDFTIVHRIAPEPDYLYTYHTIEVKCRHCDAAFTNEEVGPRDIDMQDENGDDVYLTLHNVCPRCEKHDCCELVMERLVVIKDGHTPNCMCMQCGVIYYDPHSEVKPNHSLTRVMWCHDCWSKKAFEIM